MRSATRAEAEQLSLVPAAAEPTRDRARTVLRAKKAKEQRPPVSDLPVGRVFPAFRDFVPALALRSRRIKKSVPRLLRGGERPMSMGAVPLTRWERYRLGVDEEILKDEGIVFDYLPPNFRDCPPGPCPRYRCRHHAGIEVDGDFMKVNHPDKDFDQLKETCTLRVANAGELKKGMATWSCDIQGRCRCSNGRECACDRDEFDDTCSVCQAPMKENVAARNEPEMQHAVMRCDEVGDVLNLTPERVRQIEVEAKENFKRRFAKMFPELLEEWSEQ